MPLLKYMNINIALTLSAQDYKHFKHMQLKHLRRFDTKLKELFDL